MFYDRAIEDFSNYLLSGDGVPSSENAVPVYVQYTTEQLGYVNAYVQVVADAADHNGCTYTVVEDPEGGLLHVSVAGNHVALLRHMCMAEMGFAHVNRHFEQVAAQKQAQEQAQIKAQIKGAGIWGPRNSRRRADVSD